MFLNYKGFCPRKIMLCKDRLELITCISTFLKNYKPRGF